MAYINTLTALLTLFILTGCSNKKNDLKKANLKGRVKKITEVRYSAKEKFGEVIKDTVEETTTFAFNDKGFLSEKVNFHIDGSINRTEKFEYDSKGSLLKKVAYDPHGKPIQSWLYEYESQNNLVKMQNIFGEKEILQHETYKYDENGFLIESTSYKEDGTVSTKCTYKNDKNGNCLERLYKNNDFIEVHKQKHNAQNKLIEQEIFMNNLVFSKREFKYIGDDLIEEISYPSSYSPATTTWKYEYKTFDEKGNWTTKILHWDNGTNNTVALTERKIIYYN